MYNVSQMMDQSHSQMPRWSAAMDPGNRFWNDDTGMLNSTQQQIAAFAAMTAPTPTGSSLANDSTCNWPESSELAHSRTGANMFHDIWDPVPIAPQDVRTEVQNIFSVRASQNESAQQDNSHAARQDLSDSARQDISQSAPAGSDFTTSATQQDLGKQRDASALSRTRSQPNTAEQKQANARESQRKFRIRQKVGFMQDTAHYAHELTSMGCIAFSFHACNVADIRSQSQQKKNTCILRRSTGCIADSASREWGLKRHCLLLQARSQAIEAQLASTVAELCKLRVRQQQLESRNLLLEKCSRLTKQNEDHLSAVSNHLCAILQQANTSRKGQ